jgi:hypothetical protein
LKDMAAPRAIMCGSWAESETPISYLEDRGFNTLSYRVSRSFQAHKSLMLWLG